MKPAAVQLTAPAPGAIAVILLTAPDCGIAAGNRGIGGPADVSAPDAVPHDLQNILRQITPSPRALTLPVGGLTKTTLLAPTGDPLDDALIIRTAPDRFELHLHGGTAVVAAVLDALQAAGTQILPLKEAGHLLAPGIQGELQFALPQALTQTALTLLLAQPQAWQAWTAHWQNFLAQPAAEKHLWQLHSAAQWLLERSRTLARLFHPARVAIIGPPNAGKSSLANALLGRPVAITSHLPGTTRDWIDAPAIFTTGIGDRGIGGPADIPPLAPAVHVPILLIDTAGIRATPDPLEQTSIARAHHQAAAADVLLLLFDATRGPTPEELALCDAYPGLPAVIAATKIDALAAPLTSPLAPPLPAPLAARNALPLSAHTRRGIPQLMTAVLTQLDLHTINPREPFAFTPRQKNLLADLALAPTPPSAARLLQRLMRNEQRFPHSSLIPSSSAHTPAPPAPWDRFPSSPPS